MVICPDCGKDVKDAKFCSNCGALLKKSEDKKTIEVEESEPEIKNDSDDIETIDSGYADTSQTAEEKTTDEAPTETAIVKKSKFCTNCGFELDRDYKFCPECGFDLSGKAANAPKNPPVVAEEKSMIVSVILSVIFPGLGHFYLNLNHKGILFLLGYIISAVLVIFLIGAILCLIVWIWALIDVIQSTTAINNGEFVEDKLF